ncbi:unnamed protein product [Polarella glacialis]|uniref:Uncharacterized protein n=1 Tax=Polarella glacialis TaxID=89957 RepID=A0A813JBF0_POLGL|nr:unnamed protein product [Polarella glacialis]
MAELFLAVVACEPFPKQSQGVVDLADDQEISCAVALGSAYLRTAVPSKITDCLQAWQVPSAFSVCTVAVLAGDRALGTVSVPIMRLRKTAGKTLDEWFPVVPAPGELSEVRLRLLLHFRPQPSQGEVAGPSETLPGSFHAKCTELLSRHAGLQISPVERADGDSLWTSDFDSRQSENGLVPRAQKPDLSVARDEPQDEWTKSESEASVEASVPEEDLSKGGTACETSQLDRGASLHRLERPEGSVAHSISPESRGASPAIGAPAVQLDEEVCGESLAALEEELEQLLRCCRSMEMRRLVAPKEADSRDGHRVSSPDSSALQGERSWSAHQRSEQQQSQHRIIYEEARAQLMAQKDALERESAELTTHWAALQLDHDTRREDLTVRRSGRAAARSMLLTLEAEVEEAADELREAQAQAAGRLVTRRQLQRDLAAGVVHFGREASSQRSTGEELREARAALREEAVSLGRELQACVSQGDELVSENLRLRSEAAAVQKLEELAEHLKLEGYASSNYAELRQAAEHCERLRSLRILGAMEIPSDRNGAVRQHPAQLRVAKAGCSGSEEGAEEIRHEETDVPSVEVSGETGTKQTLPEWERLLEARDLDPRCPKSRQSFELTIGASLDCLNELPAASLEDAALTKPDALKKGDMRLG